jgi:hypothetical protein
MFIEYPLPSPRVLLPHQHAIAASAAAAAS